MAASTEIWKCDVCDRMTLFDEPSAPVSRYMRRIDAESLGKDELAREHTSGVCFNNLLFNEVDWFVDSKRERSGEKGAAPVKVWRRYSQVWRSEA